MSASRKYKQLLAQHLKAEERDIFLYWKGRVALFTILKAANIGKGDEVILPAFTCVVVPNAIIYLGATPIYVDIDKQSLNAEPQAIFNKVTSKTKAIICQNTFGLSTGVKEISEYGRKNNILTIEDCTHGFGGEFQNQPNGSYCDAAFFSTQWNKPFSTGIGGFAYVRSPVLKASIQQINQSLIDPTIKDVKVLALLVFIKNNLLTPSTYWVMRSVYRWLSKNNLIIGSSSGKEITGLEYPVDYFKGSSTVQAKIGSEQIAKILPVLAKRKKSAELYTDLLMKYDKWHVEKKFFKDHSFLKYPILVKNRDLFMSLGEQSSIELGDWFCSPLHPVMENLDRWGLDVNKTPVAKEISACIVNLPTEHDEGVIKFLKNNLAQIL
ncbi:MAG: DegT/DnrJ/EryC1/StrS family aminotransferase [Flavobacteriales bacterium]|nr:DegT/DnrJ/EryC1/StrS family aminotransferase [Flavobacteriales bacterium]